MGLESSQQPGLALWGIPWLGLVKGPQGPERQLEGQRVGGQPEAPGATKSDQSWDCSDRSWDLGKPRGLPEPVSLSLGLRQSEAW